MRKWVEHVHARWLDWWGVQPPPSVAFKEEGEQRGGDATWESRAEGAKPRIFVHYDADGSLTNKIARWKAYDPADFPETLYHELYAVTWDGILGEEERSYRGVKGLKSALAQLKLSPQHKPKVWQAEIYWTEVTEEFVKSDD